MFVVVLRGAGLTGTTLLSAAPFLVNFGSSRRPKTTNCQTKIFVVVSPEIHETSLTVSPVGTVLYCSQLRSISRIKRACCSGPLGSAL